MKKILFIIAAIAVLTGCKNGGSNKNQIEAQETPVERVIKPISKERIFVYQGIDNVGDTIPDTDNGMAFINEYDTENNLISTVGYVLEDGESYYDFKNVAEYTNGTIFKMHNIDEYGDTTTIFLQDGKWKAKRGNAVRNAREGFQPSMRVIVEELDNGKCKMDGGVSGRFTKHDEDGRWTEAIMSGGSFIVIAKREILATHQ